MSYARVRLGNSDWTPLDKEETKAFIHYCKKNKRKGIIDYGRWEDGRWVSGTWNSNGEFKHSRKPKYVTL
jgi:hypothetical protein